MTGKADLPLERRRGHGELNDRLILMLVEAARSGANRTEAASMCDVTPDALRFWLRRGARDQRRREVTIHARLRRQWDAAVAKRFKEMADVLFKRGTEGFVERVVTKIVAADGTEMVTQIVERHHAPDIAAASLWMRVVGEPSRKDRIPDEQPKPREKSSYDTWLEMLTAKLAADDDEETRASNARDVTPGPDAPALPPGAEPEKP